MTMGSNDKQVNKNHRLIQALKHAVQGSRSVVLQERNMRYHIGAAVIAIIAGFYFQIDEFEWLWIILAIFSVFLSEFANTVAESLTDLIVQKKYDPLAKRIKDVSAGGVLLSAIFAVIVGAIIFIPKLF